MANTNNLTDFLTDVADAIRAKKGTTGTINPQDFSDEIASISTGTDTSDATATAADILKDKTAYVATGKVSGTIETYNGETEDVAPGWIGTVANLGTESPTAVTFTKSADFPTTWETVTQDSVEFVKIPKMYKKINTVVDNQITGYSISNAALDSEYKVYPCFLDESGNELDYILIAKSISYASTTITNARTQARAKGTGYMIMDWQIKRLWEDLIILLYETVNINRGGRVATDLLGLSWGSLWQWVDGIAKDGTTWVACDKPSKYVNTATSSTDGYYAVSYSAPTTSNEIQKLGYDSNHPFVNMPSAVVSNASYDTYYCDYYRYGSGNLPVYCYVVYVDGDDDTDGAFDCYTRYAWSDAPLYGGSRLCYRPIS